MIDLAWAQRRTFVALGQRSSIVREAGFASQPPDHSLRWPRFPNDMYPRLAGCRNKGIRTEDLTMVMRIIL